MTRKGIRNELYQFPESANLANEEIEKAYFLWSFDWEAKPGDEEVTRRSYYDMEKRDRKGVLQIKTMQKIAEAMGCEFICAIRPKSRKTFSRDLGIGFFLMR